MKYKYTLKEQARITGQRMAEMQSINGRRMTPHEVDVYASGYMDGLLETLDTEDVEIMIDEIIERVQYVERWHAVDQLVQNVEISEETAIDCLGYDLDTMKRWMEQREAIIEAQRVCDQIDAEDLLKTKNHRN